MRTTNNNTSCPAPDNTPRTTKSCKPPRAALLALLVGLSLATPAFAGPEPLQNTRKEPGGLLALFENLYWRWAYGDLTLPTDRNSNAVVGVVAMVPIPYAPGDGTPATQDVTLNAGQPWMLPLWNLLGTTYTNGTPPDPIVGLSIFQTLDITFTIDGRTVVNTQNVMEYFSKFHFVPPAPVDYPPANAIIWFEGIGVLHEGFRPGNHTLKLDVKNTQPMPPNFGGGVAEYHNTWNITVKRDL